MRIKLGIQDCLYLGNIDTLRDWGHEKDYVKKMWLMMQQDKPDDFVIATGEHYSVREFVERAAKKLNLSIKWQGKDSNEIGLVEGRPIVRIDPKYFRPTEVEKL